MMYVAYLLGGSLYVINHLLDDITFIYHDHSELFDITLGEMAIRGD